MVALLTALLLLLCGGSPAGASFSGVSISYDSSLRAAAFGTERLRAALVRAGAYPEIVALGGGEAAAAGPPADVVVARRPAAATAELVEGAFTIDLHQTDGANGTSVVTLLIAAADDAGAMYACLELAERLDTHMLQRRMHRRVPSVVVWDDFLASLPLPLDVAPRFDYRALKFNLPWSAYRPGNATVENYALCRNLTFWASFLDMMAENRYNVITLWALHPWPYMVTPTNFPKAASFGDTHHWGGPPDGTETEAEWKAFWTGLFKLAKDRAIDPYVVDWNIFLSEGYKNGYDSKAITDHDGSGGKGTANPQADRYQREVITQVTKKFLSLHFLQLKRIILPRQARDKHRKISKRDVYSYRLLTSMRILLVSESRSASGAMRENTRLRVSAFHDAFVLSLSWQTHCVSS